MDTSGRDEEHFVDRRPGSIFFLVNVLSLFYFFLLIIFIGSRWKQQTLPAFQPILTPRLVIAIYVIVGLIFIPLGIVFLTSSDKVCFTLYF